MYQSGYFGLFRNGYRDLGTISSLFYNTGPVPRCFVKTFCTVSKEQVVVTYDVISDHADGFIKIRFDHSYPQAFIKIRVVLKIFEKRDKQF